MNSDSSSNDSSDRLESFGIYRLARELFDEFWDDAEIMGKDFRGRELAGQQVRCLDSICVNIEEGYGRGFGKELPQHLKIARSEAREGVAATSAARTCFPPEPLPSEPKH